VGIRSEIHGREISSLPPIWRPPAVSSPKDLPQKLKLDRQRSTIGLGPSFHHATTTIAPRSSTIHQCPPSLYNKPPLSSLDPTNPKSLRLQYPPTLETRLIASAAKNTTIEIARGRHPRSNGVQYKRHDPRIRRLWTASGEMGS
jgi:hypothetical protein